MTTTCYNYSIKGYGKPLEEAVANTKFRPVTRSRRWRTLGKQAHRLHGKPLEEAARSGRAIDRHPSWGFLYPPF